MKFQLDEMMADMAAAIKGEVTDNWGAAQTIVNDFLQSRKTRLDLLVDLRLKDEITQEFFEERLKDEKKIMKAEFHTIAVISKATAQRAVNAAFGVLEKTVSTVLGIL